METNETWRGRLEELKCVNGAMYFGATETPCSGRDTGECCFYEQTYEEAINELTDFIQSEIDKALAQQKREIVEIVSKYDGDLCYATGNIIKEINNLK